MVANQDLPPKLICTLDTCARWMDDLRGRHRHALRIDKSLRYNGLERVPVYKSKDNGGAGWHLDINGPIPPAAKHISALAFRAHRLPSARPHQSYKNR